MDLRDRGQRFVARGLGLGAGGLQDLLGLLLGRVHAVLGGAVGLGDPLARAGLGLLAQLGGRAFGRFDDARDALGGGLQGVGGVHIGQS